MPPPCRRVLNPEPVVRAEIITHRPHVRLSAFHGQAAQVRQRVNVGPGRRAKGAASARAFIVCYRASARAVATQLATSAFFGMRPADFTTPSTTKPGVARMP